MGDRIMDEKAQVELTNVEIGIADLELQANDVQSRIALLQVKALAEISDNLKSLKESIQESNQDTNH